MYCEIRVQTHQIRQYVLVKYSKETQTQQNKLPANKYLYNWILHHPQVVKYKIDNDCLKVSIDSHSETQLVPKLLLEVYVQELHNIMASQPEAVGLKEARYSEKNIIVSDFTLCNIFHPKSIRCLHNTRLCVGKSV